MSYKNNSRIAEKRRKLDIEANKNKREILEGKRQKCDLQLNYCSMLHSWGARRLEVHEVVANEQLWYINA